MFFRNFKSINQLIKEINEFESLFFNQEIDSSKSNFENSNWEKKYFTSEDGLFSYSIMVRKPNNRKIDELSELKYQLNELVEKQEFEKAVEIRDKIKKLESNKEKLNKLNEELSESIKKQDFENAIKLRDKINSLK